MSIKKFYCGFCKDEFARSRKGLRNHIRGHIRNNFANVSHKPSERLVKQSWWIVEDFK